MSFRSFQHNYHEGQLTNIAVGPRREVTLEVQLNAWCDKTATMATVRLDAIENFEEVRTFLAQAGRGPTELDCLRLLTEGPNWVFLGFSDGRSITIRSHHVTESE